MFTIREIDRETGTAHVVPGADQYLLMVEHFAEAASGNDEPELSCRDSINNMRVLDALAEAARTGNTVRMEQEFVE
jgi:predicted dehydrogenase